jgi:hypothetical protein
VPAEDELAAGHDECGNTAHYEHRQAVHLTHAAGKPVPHLGRRRWHQVSAGGPQRAAAGDPDPSIWFPVGA